MTVRSIGDVFVLAHVLDVSSPVNMQEAAASSFSAESKDHRRGFVFGRGDPEPGPTAAGRGGGWATTSA